MPQYTQLSWGEALSKCGSDAREDYPAAGSECISIFYDKLDAAAMFGACDEQYCRGTNSTWNVLTQKCDTVHSTCRLTCGCMEEHYARFMECSFTSILARLDHPSCAASKIRECVIDSKTEFVDECKRGVRQGRISWMEEPLPSTDCDEKRVCAGSSLSPIGLLSIILTLVVVLFN